MGALRKAAVLLMSLPQQEAARLLSKLAPKEVEAVSIEIASLTNITPHEQERVFNEFASVNPGIVSGGSPGLDFAQSAAQKALGKNAVRTTDNLKRQIEAIPFGFLNNVDSQSLLTFIIDEHPQTIALILCHLSPAQAADIIAGLPNDRQLSVVRRIATMGQTNPEIINEVERGLYTRMAGVLSQSFESAGGAQSAAAVLNVIDRAIERVLLENLGQEDAQLLEEIRRAMFVFEDITKFSSKDVQTVLKNVETAQWAMALKGASDTLKTKIYSNLSHRAANTLREEMEYLGPVKRSAVEQAQQQIIDCIRRLQDNGEMAVNTGEEEEQLIG